MKIHSFGYADLRTSQSFHKLQQIKAQLGSFLRSLLKQSCGNMLSIIAAYRQFNWEPLDHYHSNVDAEHPLVEALHERHQGEFFDLFSTSMRTVDNIATWL